MTAVAHMLFHSLWALFTAGGLWGAITVKIYGQGMLKTVTGSIDWDTDTFHLILRDNTDPPDLDADDFRNDLTGELATASGYTSGGVALASPAVTYDSATDQVRLDFADPSWTFSGSVTWRYGDVVKWRGGASSADEVLANLDWGANQTVSTPYTLTLDPAGLLFIDVT